MYVNINASLLREARMIYQHLFRKSPGSIPFQQQESSLSCAFCIQVRRGKPEKAITIMNGQAVCRAHSNYVKTGEFERLLTVVKMNEKR